MKTDKLLTLIPPSVRITRDVTYEVVWLDEFSDGQTLGECRPDTRQIVIKNGQSPTETYKTFIHELFHAISFETENLNLTEKQVRLLEESTFRVLKLNKTLELLVKNS